MNGARFRGGSMYAKDFPLICGANLLIYLGFHMLTPTFPFFIRALGGSEAVIGLATGGFSLTALLMRPLIGWMLDHVSRRIPLFIGLSCLTAITLLYPWLGLLPLVIGLRLVQGFFWAATGTAVSTNAYDCVPGDRLTEGAGYLGTVTTLAMAIAPTVGLFLMEGQGFPLSFGVSGTLGLLALLLLSRFHFVDIKAQQNVGSDTQQNKQKTPFAQAFQNLINRQALPASTILLLLMIPYGGLSTFIAIYAKEAQLQGGNLFFTFFAGTACLVRIFCGKVARKKGESFLIYLGGVSFLVSILLLLFTADTAGLLLAGMFAGMAIGVMVPSLQGIALSKAAAEQRGTASSTYLCLSDAGIGIGGMLYGFLLTVGGYPLAFLFMLLPILLAILLYALWVSR